MSDTQPRHPVIQYVLRHGPTPVDELPIAGSPNPEAREQGARRFDPYNNARAVWYYPDAHDTEAVIRAWIRKNSHITDALTPRQLVLAINDAGSAFAAVSNDVARDAYSDAEYSKSFHGGNGNERPSGETHYSSLKDADPDTI